MNSLDSLMSEDEVALFQSYDKGKFPPLTKRQPDIIPAEVKSKPSKIFDFADANADTVFLADAEDAKTDSGVSAPDRALYDEYLLYCERTGNGTIKAFCLQQCPPLCERRFRRIRKRVRQYRASKGGGHE